MTAPPQIDIRIETLEVEGLSRSGALQFQRAVERELARLVVDNGLPSLALASRSLVSVEAGSLGAGQDALATDVAGAIFRALTQ